MSYKPGQVTIYDPSICPNKDEYGWCDCKTDFHEVGPYDILRDYPDQKAVFLPHSCDQWIIGGKDEIKAMIADLQAALEAL